MNLFKKFFCPKKEKKAKPLTSNAGYVSGYVPHEPDYYASTPGFYDQSSVSDETYKSSEPIHDTDFGGGSFGGSGASSDWSDNSSSGSYDSGSSDSGSSDFGSSSSCD